ncbi:hypothetical protein [Candidatus Hodarchaeum mangrovi]
MKKIVDFKLEVNGQIVSTKRFVKEVIGNSLLGQVETLRLKDPNIKTIRLEINYTDNKL